MHIESLLQLMIYDGMVEKVLVPELKGNYGIGDPIEAEAQLEEEEEEKDSAEESGAEEEDKKRKRETSDGENGDEKPRAKKNRYKLTEKSKVAAESEEFSDSDDEVRKQSGNAAQNGSDLSDDGKTKYSEALRRSKGRLNADNGSGSAAVEYVYRLIKPYKPVLGWTDMPCGNCPSEAFCTEPPRPLGYHHSGRAAYTSSGTMRKVFGSDKMKGVGMLGGAGAAIGSTSEKWGQTKIVGTAVAPVNPKDCRYFKSWLDFSAEDADGL